jgi:hypothetical protein
MASTCDICDGVTQVPGFFREGRRAFSFSLQTTVYCPICWPRRPKVSLPGSVIALVVVIGLLAGAVMRLGQHVDWEGTCLVVLKILLFCVFFVLMFVPHELGHALCARFLGWRLFAVHLGMGPSVGRFRLRGCQFVLGAIPSGGLALMAPRAVGFFRLKYFLIILAGPLANAVVFALVFTFVGPGQISVDRFGDSPPLALLAIANLCLIFVTLIPLRLMMQYGQVRRLVASDGLALLTIPFMRRDVALQYHADCFRLEGAECQEKRAYEEARAWYLQGLQHYPDDVNCRFLLGYALLFLKDFQGARNEWLQVLGHDNLLPGVSALLMNNVAWVDLMLGGEANLDEADRFSREAVSQESWHPAYQGTRGSVLIETGRVDKGLRLVRRALARADDSHVKALQACAIALGEIKNGHLEEAHAARDLARQIDPACVLLGKVNKHLESGGTP